MYLILELFVLSPCRIYFISVAFSLLMRRLLYLVWAIASHSDLFQSKPPPNPKQADAGKFSSGRLLLCRHAIYERVLSPLLSHPHASGLHKALALKIVHALLDLR
jgi:hypothetical protein